MNSAGTVTICIPAYNAEKYIAGTLDSILNQTYKDIKVIVCDNASKDNTMKIVNSIKDERLEYRRFEDYLDVNYSMVRSIKQGETDLICMFHADDWYYPTIVEEYVKYINLLEGIGAVFCKTNSVKNERDIKTVTNKQNGMIEIYDKKKYIEHAMAEGTIFHAPTLMLRKEIADKAFCYEEDYISDMSIWLKILQFSKVMDLCDFYCNHREGSKVSTIWGKRLTVSPGYILLDRETDRSMELKKSHCYIIYKKRKNKEILFVIRNRILKHRRILQYFLCLLGIKKLEAEVLEGSIENYKNVLYGRK